MPICIRGRGICDGCQRCYDEREEEDEEEMLNDEDFDVEEE